MDNAWSQSYFRFLGSLYCKIEVFLSLSRRRITEMTRETLVLTLEELQMVQRLSSRLGKI